MQFNGVQSTLPIENALQDALAIKPSILESTGSAFLKTVTEPAIALEHIDNVLRQKPESEGLKYLRATFDVQDRAPGQGIGQKAANFVAGSIPYFMPPFSLAAAPVEKGIGIIGGAVSKVLPSSATMFLSRPIKEILPAAFAKYIPKEVGAVGAEKTLSLAHTTKNMAEHAATFAVIGVPQAIVENYHDDNQSIAWGGVAKSMGDMGLVGMAIGSVPFAYGILRGKIRENAEIRAQERPEIPETELAQEQFKQSTHPIFDGVSHEEVNEAFKNGHITDKERRFVKGVHEYFQNPSDKKFNAELSRTASEIASDYGHDVDWLNNHVNYSIMSEHDMSGFSSALSDQLLGNMPEEYRKILSDFIVHNKVDALTADKSGINGLRGFIEFVEHKLKGKDRKLAEAEKIIDSLPKNLLTHETPFSQKTIADDIKKLNLDKSQVESLGFHVPRDVKKHIASLEAKKSIKDVEVHKLLTPKVELKKIKESLSRGGGSLQELLFHRDYQRLAELSEVWPQAKALLDKLHLEHEYHRQEAFSRVAKALVDTHDANFAQLGRIDLVNDYMGKRMQEELPYKYDGEYAKQVIERIDDERVRDVSRVTEEGEPTLEQHIREQLKAEEPEGKLGRDIYGELRDIAAKIEEFKGSENILKNAVLCVLGAAGG